MQAWNAKQIIFLDIISDKCKVRCPLLVFPLCNQNQVAPGLCRTAAACWKTPLNCRIALTCRRQHVTSETHHQLLRWESQEVLHAVHFPTEDFTLQNNYSLIWEFCILSKLHLLLLFMIWTFQVIKVGHSSCMGLAQWIPKANFSVKT